MSTNNDDAFINELYEEIEGDEPSAELDQRILAAAHREVNTGPSSVNRRPKWFRPVASAAVLLLAITVSLYQITDPSAPLDVVSEDSLVDISDYQETHIRLRSEKSTDPAAKPSYQATAAPKAEQQLAEEKPLESFASSSGMSDQQAEQDMIAQKTKADISHAQTESLAASAMKEPEVASFAAVEADQDTIKTTQDEEQKIVSAESRSRNKAEVQRESLAMSESMADRVANKTTKVLREAPPQSLSTETLDLQQSISSATLLTKTLLEDFKQKRSTDVITLIVEDDSYYWLRAQSGNKENAEFFKLDKSRFTITQTVSDSSGLDKDKDRPVIFDWSRIEFIPE